MKPPCCLSVAFVVSTMRLLGATDFSFVNPAGGNWSDPANWSPMGVPGAADTATIAGAGTYTVTLDVDAVVSKLTLGGGGGSPTLSDSGRGLNVGVGGTVTKGGVLTITGGRLSGGLTVTDGGRLTGVEVARLGDLTLDPGGVATLTGGTLTGIVTVAAGGRLELAGTGLTELTLDNDGEVVCAADVFGFRTSPGVVVNNAGQWTVTAGAGIITGGGGVVPRFVNTGVFRKCCGGATATVNGWVFYNMGRVEVTAGGLQVNDLGAVLGGRWTTAVGAALGIDGNYDGRITGAVFDGAGTAEFNGGTLLVPASGIPANLRLAGGTVLLSQAFQGGNITDLTLDGATLEGTHRVTGQLRLNGGGVTGGLTVANGGRVTAAQASLAGDLTVASGAVVSCAGGTLTGTATIAAGGRLELAGIGLSGVTVVNQGEVVCGNGDIGGDRTFPGVVVNNVGLWTLTQDVSFAAGGGGTAPRFTNSGRFRKAGGTATASFSGWAFENRGQLALELGTLAFDPPFTASPDSRVTFLLAGLRPQLDHGVLQLSGTADLKGTLDVAFAPGYTPAAGDLFGIAAYDRPGTDFTALAGEADQFDLLKEPTRLRLRGKPSLQGFRAPEIAAQPVGRVANPGDSVVLSVVATGSPAPSYQWRRNGRTLTGETGVQLVVNVAGPASAGGFTCAVFNDFGAVLSDPAVVTVPADALGFADNFAGRGEISSSNGVGVGTNVGGSVEAGEPRHGGKMGGSSVWLSYLAPSDGTMELATSGSDFDTLLAAYVGDTLTALTQIAANDDEDGSYTSRVRLGVKAGTRYPIAVDGRAGAVGHIVLTWLLTPSPVPPPRLLTPPSDQLATLGGIAVFSVTATDTQTFRWRKNGAPLTDDARVTGSATAKLTITGVVLGDVADYAVELAGNGVLISPTAALQVDPLAPAGLAVEAAGSRDKFGDIRDERSAGLLPSRSGPLPARGPRTRPGGLAHGVSGTQVFSTVNAATEEGEPLICGVSGGASQWFEYLAEFDGALTVDTAGSAFDTVLGAYYDACPTCSAEEALAKLVPLACANDISPTDHASRMSLSVTNGSIYSLVVDGVNGASGIVTVNFHATPVTGAAPAIIGATVTANGHLQFHVTGATGQAVRLDSGLNPSSFTPVLSTNLPAGGFIFTDASPAVAGRYFRAVAP